ncbi:hypothetical protein HRG_000509 [Hirsutella rhossiliensis]|uniref:Uncharacterized protein n=1 Tax=Hirsutella rhossiliensis TaxID=111463 RepID=A0A9P8N7B5_9HYPO|nr:uncharacterized protein HRG_00509 [Hirsutella rhossiliensis]KAH0967867.1 hypothetical protein HRG_00509 [Hirsutella rhossiliensis]
MPSLRSVVLGLVVLAVAPVSLAVPSPPDEGSVAPLQQRDADAAAPFEEPDAGEPDSVLDALAGGAQAARSACYVTNRRGQTGCAAATCIPAQQCRPSSKGRCAFKEKNIRKRPSGCRACRCARYKGS